MLIVIGSSSQVALGIYKIDKSTNFIGRSNPSKFNNWRQGGDLSTNEGIDQTLNILQQILETNIKNSFIHVIFLNGVSNNDWDSSINVNLLATAKLAEQFCIHLKEKNLQGSITLIGSASSYLGGKLPYSMTKASLIGLMNTLNIQYCPNIRVNMILPGAIESGMTDDWSNEKKSRIAQTTYQKRLANIDEIANSIIFCTQNTYLSGSTINMTSGGVK
jgi:NAD(P)-dependent dehydrogenase (short-subunit alcohol dehydrogenase family)